MNSIKFEAIGTHWSIDIDGDIPVDVFDRIRGRIEVFENIYSRFRPNSLVSTMSQKADTYLLTDDAKPMLDLYEKLYKITRGAFTPLIGSLLAEAGYDASYSLTPKELHTPPKWEDVLDYSFPTLTLEKSAKLDFGSLGKGYMIDTVGEMLDQQSIHSYCVDAGGDMRYRNSQNEPLRVGLEDPGDPGKVIGVATLKTGQSLCGSAGNRRAWDKFHHIMDPRTLGSPRHLLTAWTVAKTTLIADAMATCLFLVSPTDLLPHFDFEYLILRPDYTVEMSKGFEGEVFEKEG